jgi:NAD(P)-dependent dehydrogenase (short-subunit alcohol dehydrogenase family)
MGAIEEQVMLVTGATDGLGKAVALDLAQRGATVLVHGRDEQRIKATIEELQERSGNTRLRGYCADFSQLAAVARLADELLAREPALHVLVNNAGIGTDVPGGKARQESQDGHELRFAVNYLAPFLLTQRLLPRLVASAPARIVNVSSIGQQPIDFDDPMIEHGYSGERAYCQSKLAQILFTIELSQRLRGTNVTVNALHPATYMPTKIVAKPVSTLEEGTRATVRLIVEPDFAQRSGLYFNVERESSPNAQAADEAARVRLWELSERLTNQITASP